MSRRSFQRHSLLHSNASSGTRIYSGILLANPPVPVAIKEQLFSDISSANLAIREAIAMLALSHPNVVRLYDCTLEPAEAGQIRSVIVMELMARDVDSERRVRQMNNQPWTDREMISLLISLVEVFSSAQERGISHRDIKPHNLFLSSDGVVKVGDFGSSTQKLKSSHVSESIRGTPYYLSPELKREYLKFVQDSTCEIQYEPVRSDVYSLGVTLAELAMLKLPEGLGKMVDLQREIDGVVAALANYPHLQPMVQWMLTVDAATRPTFLDMRAYFQTYRDYYNAFVAGAEGDQCVATLAPQEIDSCPDQKQQSGGWISEEEPKVKGWISEEEPKVSGWMSEEESKANDWEYTDCSPYQLTCSRCFRLFTAPDESVELCEECRENPKSELCANCAREFWEKITEVPEELDSARGYASFCCSLSCLSALRLCIGDSDYQEGEVPADPECEEKDPPATCCYCGEILSSDSVEMSCGHSFHSVRCLFDFTAVASKNFSQSNPQCRCPVCLRVFSYKKHLLANLDPEEVRRRREMRCIFCDSYSVVGFAEPEGVWFCERHLPKKEKKKLKQHRNSRK